MNESIGHRLIRPGRARMAQFLAVLGRWMEQGMAPAQAVASLVELYRGRVEGRVARDLFAALQSGMPLSSGLRQWLDAADSHRVAALERSSNLPVQLQALAEQMLERKTLAAVLAAKLAYGLLLVIAVGAILVLVVAEEILPILQDSGLAASTVPEFHLLTAISSHLADWWWLWPLGLGGAIGCTWAVATLWTGRWRNHCDRLPLWRWHRCQIGASLLQTLALLVHSGDTWMLAAQRLATTGSPYRRWLLANFQDQLSEGRSPVAALEQAGWLTLGSTLQLRAMAGDDNLSEQATRIARQQILEGEQSMLNAVRTLQLLLYLIAGAGLFLVLSTGRLLSSPGEGAF